jgi:GDP-4-dehydro-6-deoxy-D-mannose reductase
LAEHLRGAGDEVTEVDAEVDVADLRAVTEAMDATAPEAVYHLAALTHVGDSWSAPDAVLNVNVLGTANVLAAARAVGLVPTVLMVSSSEVYGVVREDQLPLTESAAVAPVTPYAASKAAAEQVALQAFRGYGQPVIVVRPFNHIGPGQSPQFAVSGLARRIVAARMNGSDTLEVGTLSTRRDFTDVRDVVRAYRLAVLQGRPGVVYNVCSGRSIEMSEIAARLMALAGVRLETAPDPSLIRPVDLPVFVGSAELLETTTGWKPQIPLEDTLRDVVDYWAAQLG